MKSFGLICIAMLSLLMISSPTMALTPFKTAFKKKYVDKHKDTAFKDTFKKVGCHTCHIPKAKKVPDVKKHLNEYAQELAKLIEGNANQRTKDARKKGSDEYKAEKEKILKELEKAFDAVAKKKSKAGDVYGEKIKGGKLPAAE